MNSRFIAISKHDEALAHARDVVAVQDEDDLADMMASISELQKSRDPELSAIGYFAALGFSAAYISSGRVCA